MLLMLSATFTGIIITKFESALAACVVLTSFIPMLSGTGGNSGSQSSVAVIRALSLDEIDFSDLIAVVWKESRVAVPVRGVPGLRQLRKNDGCGPVADEQPGGHPPWWPWWCASPWCLPCCAPRWWLHPPHGGGENRH